MGSQATEEAPATAAPEVQAAPILSILMFSTSGFERFRIDQREALTPGGCPIPYLVDPAEIERVGQDQYLLTFSAAFTSQEEYQLCLEQAEDPDDCDLAPPVPREALTLNT